MRAVVIPSRVHCKNSEAFSGSRPFFDHQDKWIYLLLNTLCNLVVFLTTTKRQNQQTTHFQLWLCGFVLCMQSFIHPGRLTAGTNKSPMKKKNKKIFEKKSKKKNCRKWCSQPFKSSKVENLWISMGFISTARLARKWPTSNGRHLCSGDFETGLEGGPICHQWSLVRFASVDSVKFGFFL